MLFDKIKKAEKDPILGLTEEFKKDEGLDLTKDPMALQRLKEAAEMGIMMAGILSSPHMYQSYQRL